MPAKTSHSIPSSAPLRSTCPVAAALDVLGDRWTLLVIRDLFLGHQRYGDFLTSPESIPTNILADRLRRLTETGLAEAKPYQDRPVRLEYRLTRQGRSLLPLLREFAAWGEAHFPGTARRITKKHVRSGE